MREEKKTGKRDLNAANDSDCDELLDFARRNRVSMDEARAIAGQFGHERPIASEGAKSKVHQPAKPRTPQARTVKGRPWGDAAMNDTEDEFMDKWLDRNITSSRPEHREPSAAEARIAGAEKQDVSRRTLEAEVADAGHATSDQPNVANARKKE